MATAPTCYLCGAPNPTTRDHVPPAGFFPDPKPDNLITVPCCERCNRSFTLHDEAFRAWVTAPPDLSAAGKWIQQNKVFANTFKNSPKLVENIRRSLREVEADGRKLDFLDFPQDRADRFLVRIAKGLLAHFFPEFDRTTQIFEVTNLTHRWSGSEQIAILRDAAIYDQRGAGVFQFRYRVSLELNRGYWLFAFYEASLFLVWHQAKDAKDPVTIERPTEG